MEYIWRGVLTDALRRHALRAHMTEDTVIDTAFGDRRKTNCRAFSLRLTDVNVPQTNPAKHHAGLKPAFASAARIWCEASAPRNACTAGRCLRAATTAKS